jgi:plastocyanin
MRLSALASTAMLLASAQLALTKIINVTVGGTTLTFTPSSVVADPEDVVVFTFLAKNHTVTESTFANPCTPRPRPSFDSGFMPFNGTTLQAQLRIPDRNPIWAYCRQGAHCSSGMVFAVNPGNDFPAFLAAARGGTPSSSSPSVLPTTTPAPVPPSPIPSSADHRVIVGGPGQLLFSPANITALPGDTITFEFHQKNHTVTASSFNEPCRDLLDSTGVAGFNSGFRPVSDATTNFPTYVVQVNDTKPIWAYCKQGNHCVSGMLFAVNAVPTSDKSFAAFQSNALKATSTGTYPSPTSGAWRPAVGSSSMVVVLGLAAAALLL